MRKHAKLRTWFGNLSIAKKMGVGYGIVFVAMIVSLILVVGFIVVVSSTRDQIKRTKERTVLLSQQLETLTETVRTYSNFIICSPSIQATLQMPNLSYYDEIYIRNTMSGFLQQGQPVDGFVIRTDHSVISSHNAEEQLSKRDSDTLIYKNEAGYPKAIYLHQGQDARYFLFTTDMYNWTDGSYLGELTTVVRESRIAALLEKQQIPKGDILLLDGQHRMLSATDTEIPGKEF